MFKLFIQRYMDLKDRSIWDSRVRWNPPIWKENCPFCNFIEDEKNLIIWEWKYWNIRHNKYPYNWNNKHLLVIPKSHKEHTKDLSKAEFSELKEISKFMDEYYKDENYFSFIRESSWWKSIKHLHYHYITWVLYSSDMEYILSKQNKTK